MAALAAAGRGFRVGAAAVPIVPAAILFDLANGGDKAWGREPPYRRLGAEAFATASADFALGSAGAGTGATTADLKGGLGSASVRLANGFTVGALAAVNALGRVTLGPDGHFRAAAFEQDGEFGGRGLPHPLPDDVTRVVVKRHARAGESTTLAVVATDARLTKTEANRLAVMAHDGFAHALWPAHTLYDGDIVFALATGGSGRTPSPAEMVELGAAAAAAAARAIARGIFAATPAEGDPLPTWRQRYGA
jgi:L-aminopeptidase/D-esterase-like protein